MPLYILPEEEHQPYDCRCNGCGKTPDQLTEYKMLAMDEDHKDALTAVQKEEGTYNPTNGHFWCTSCYIRVGQPLGVAP